MPEPLCVQAFNKMEEAVHSFARQVPQPQIVHFRGGFDYRYIEKTLHQALVQKLARYISTLKAADLLMSHGFVQEQMALKRVFEEIQEDILFLLFAGTEVEVTPPDPVEPTCLETYLDKFYQESFDETTLFLDPKPGNFRKEIRDYVARKLTSEGGTENPERAEEAREMMRKSRKIYSGYVHAASPEILIMYGGTPPHFQVEGLPLGGSQHDTHRSDLLISVFQALCAFHFAARAFGNHQITSNLKELLDKWRRR